MTAGALYILGALGMEMIEAVMMDRSTDGDLSSVDFVAINRTSGMILMVTVEELCEMVAVALALRALLIHLTQELHVRLFSMEAVADAAQSEQTRSLPGSRRD